MGRKSIYATEEERKAAHRASDRAWRERNREKENARQKAYYEEHREERLAYRKNYAEAHKEEIKAYQKNYAEANSEELKAYHKAYHEANREKENARNNAYKKDYYKDPFWNEINRITERDGKRIRKLGLILEGQEVHHHKYHADNNDESWMEDIEIMDRRQHIAWHRFHAEWKAEIV